jgi:hypothetical protein
MKPELIIRARAERRFTFDSLAEVARAREALEAERLDLENALTLLDYIESDLQPPRGAC